MFSPPDRRRQTRSAGERRVVLHLPLILMLFDCGRCLPWSARGVRRRPPAAPAGVIVATSCTRQIGMPVLGARRRVRFGGGRRGRGFTAVAGCAGPGFAAASVCAESRTGLTDTALEQRARRRTGLSAIDDAPGNSSVGGYCGFSPRLPLPSAAHPSACFAMAWLPSWQAYS